MPDPSASSSEDDSELGISLQSFENDAVTVALVGRLDVLEAARVREFLATEPAASAQHLTVDLTDVSFVDSAGLAVLARARRDRVLAGGTVTLIKPKSDDAMRVFRLTQFDEIFTMIDSHEGGGHQ